MVVQTGIKHRFGFRFCFRDYYIGSLPSKNEPPLTLIFSHYCFFLSLDVIFIFYFLNSNFFKESSSLLVKLSPLACPIGQYAMKSIGDRNTGESPAGLLCRFTLAGNRTSLALPMNSVFIN